MRTTNDTNETKHVHEVRNASAVSGAVLGATAGIMGGIAGIGTAGLLGAFIGALGGLALESDMRRAAERDAEDADLPEGLTKAEREAAVGIEPACPDCLEVRSSSAGTVPWCARHTAHHPHAHLHHEYPESFAMGSLLIRPSS